MPTYEYVCRKCGAQTDVFATIAEKEAGLKPLCPMCGSDKMSQLYSSLNIMGFTRNAGGTSGCGPRSGSGCCG